MINLFTPEQLDSLKWRIWNTFKSVVLPIVLGMVLVELQEHGNFDGILTKDVWINIAYAVVVALVGSAIAGLDKVSRMTK
jgi:hypothetical protein